MTYSLPHALVPVANVPLIEYCLELLVSAGVAQVFIVASEHTEALQKYIDSSQSCQQFMEVQLIVAPGCKSPGQALRDVDSRDKIRGDFILCNVDTVAHLKLAPALAAHKRRREEEKNKDAIFTMIMRPSDPAQRQAIFPDEDTLVALDPDSKRLVHYQSMTSKGLSMDIVGPDNVHRFEAHPKIQGTKRAAGCAEPTVNAIAARGRGTVADCRGVAQCGTTSSSRASASARLRRCVSSQTNSTGRYLPASQPRNLATKQPFRDEGVHLHLTPRTIHTEPQTIPLAPAACRELVCKHWCAHARPIKALWG